MEKIVYQPIGFFRCAQTQPVDSPRQGVLAEENSGCLELSPDFPLEALRDLASFDRVWLLYDFHHNSQWKPMVRPPRGSDKKRGVLATRSPYRPNAIGMSCVRLEKIEGHKIYCSEHDLLDGSPILDIKPYLNFSDSFPEAKQGWLQDLVSFEVEFSEKALEQVRWLGDKLGKSLQQIIRNQLEFEPTHSKIKRVKKFGSMYRLSYRTWRIEFQIEGHRVNVGQILSGYQVEELNRDDDPYEDKLLHREFIKKFQFVP